MPQDAFTLRYLCQELNDIFSGGKVNKIISPDGDKIVFIAYTGKAIKKLLIDVNPASPRIGVVENEGESPLTAPNFCMLMRKHLQSSTIDKISLVGFDRIVKIDFTVSGEFTNQEKKTVYAELMGRYSNIILTQNGKVLGGNRGINMFDDGVRPLIVGKQYVFPPVGQKCLPNASQTLDYFAQYDGGDFVKYICEGVQGIAISTANEIVTAYQKEYGEYTAEKSNIFYDFFNEFIYNTPSKPCVTIDSQGVKDVFAFPYLSSLAIQTIYFDNLCTAEEYYFAQREKLKAFKLKKERLTAIISAKLKKAKKRLSAITSKEKEAEKAEENKLKGEILLANVYAIKGHQKTCTLFNYYDNCYIEIELDEQLSPSQNAEKYYKKYNKMKRTLQALETQRAQAQSELDYFEGLWDTLAIAKEHEELLFVQKELEEEGFMCAKKDVKKKEEKSFCREYFVHDFRVMVGRNNKENDRLVKNSKGGDLWLHAKDYHSSHLIIETEQRRVPENVLAICAQICAYYSKGRAGGNVEIVYTERKNVKKPSGAKPGFVTYDKYNSLVVQANEHAQFKN